MKSNILARLAALTNAVNEFCDRANLAVLEIDFLVEQLPNDGSPSPVETPQNVRVTSATSVGGPLDIRFTWDAPIESGLTTAIDFKDRDHSEWTDCGPAFDGKGTIVVPVPFIDGVPDELQIRVRFMRVGDVWSEPSVITFTAQEVPAP